MSWASLASAAPSREVVSHNRASHRLFKRRQFGPDVAERERVDPVGDGVIMGAGVNHHQSVQPEVISCVTH